jgi:hypothetical protein
VASAFKVYVYLYNEGGTNPENVKYFSSDRPTAAARQGREAVEEFAIRAWIGAGSDKDPNVITVDLHAVNPIIWRSNVGAGDVPLHALAWSGDLQAIPALIV